MKGAVRGRIGDWDIDPKDKEISGANMEGHGA